MDKRFVIVNGVLMVRKPFTADMTDREAVELSIEKWNVIVENRYRYTLDRAEKNIGADSCALCFKYYYKGCVGCPIRDLTGKTECGGTPFKRTIFFHSLKSAVDMREFLKKTLEYVEKKELDKVETV